MEEFTFGRADPLTGDVPLRSKKGREINKRPHVSSAEDHQVIREESIKRHGESPRSTEAFNRANFHKFMITLLRTSSARQKRRGGQRITLSNSSCTGEETYCLTIGIKIVIIQVQN